MSKREEELSIARLCHSTSSNMAIMEFEGLGKEYYDDDSDKEFDMAIDPLWEAQQISTFTAWCNVHLRQVNIKIDSFENDFRNGLKLRKLLEIISNESLPLPDKGKMRFHKIANVNKCLKFIEEKDIKLASIGAEEIVDGNVKMTLGMIWTIILRFEIQDIKVEDLSARDGLLLWCKRRTNGYKSIKVENFKTSFQDGLVFCALIHSYDNSLINYDSLSPTDISHNLKLAFTIAENSLDVPQMLNIDDMINCKESDERSMMTYVSSYYHAIERKEKVNIALKNIFKIISKEMEESQSEFDSNKLSTNILKWIQMWIEEFQDRPQFDDLSHLNVKIVNFQNYKSVDKPEKTKERIQSQFENLKIPSLNNRNTSSNIQSSWNMMEKLENPYEAYLLKEKHRYDLIQNLLDIFEINFQFQRDWISNRIDILLSKDYESANLCDLNKLRRSQETFLSNIESHKARTDKIINIAEELRRLNYKEMDTINKKVSIIVNPWDSLIHLNNQRNDSINTFYNALREVDDLQLEFAKRVIPLYNWIQQAIQDLNDTFVFHTIEDLKDLVKAQENFKSTMVDAIDELKNTKSLNDRICRIITVTGIQKVPLNPYTEVLLQEVQKAWVQLERTIPERDKSLNEALNKEISLKDCKDNFTKLMKIVGDDLLDIQKCTYDLVSLNIETNKNASKEQSLKIRLFKCAPHLKEVMIMNEKLGEDKQTNLKTNFSFEQLRATYEILDYLLSELCRTSMHQDSINSLLDNSYCNKFDEYRECFKHFDRSNSNQVDIQQFRACMLSLGYSVDENDQNDKQFKDMISVIDPNNTGVVSLSSFLDFMTRKTVIKDNSEQLIESFKILANNKKVISRNVIIKELPERIAEYCLDKMPVQISPNGDNESYLDYNLFSKNLLHNHSSYEIINSEQLS